MAEARVPQHIAIIMDGNRRWARERGLPVVEGHRRASERIFDLCEMVAARGIPYVTVYAFSTENWKRAQDEVGFLMSLLERFLNVQVKRLHEAGFRVKFLGSREGVDAKLVRGIERAEELTQNNARLTINICFNYGARPDLIEAVRGIVREGVPADQIDESVIESHLMTAGLPPVDLVLRTSGEQRLSNFLLWEVAYAELMFLDCYWPDFGETEMDEALAEYGRRQRRYGS